MATLARETKVLPAAAESRGGRFAAVPPAVPVLLAALFLAALNPIGFIGGGADDWHYLQAARCAAEHGFCMPVDHWWRRFPLVVPTGAVIALLGESRQNLWIVPAAYSLAAILLFAGLAERQFGRRAALIAGLAFVFTPVFSERILDFGVDVAELAFMLASLFCFQSAYRAGGSRWAAAAGAMLALAAMTRPTALALLPILAGAFLLVGAMRRMLPLFLLGFAVPLGAESIGYWIAAGDPWLSWKLSLVHARVPSSELMNSVDTRQSPLFNIAYIDGWVPARGIEVHWTVDALLNLLAHPSTGLTLVCALAFLALHRRRLRPSDSEGAILLLLVGAAMLYFGALVFAFAVDPKPRMFLPVVAVAAACIGVLGAVSWARGERALVVAALLAIAATGLIQPFDRVSFARVEAVAPQWIDEGPEGLGVFARTRQHLALVPAIGTRPVKERYSHGPMLMTGERDCPAAVATAHLPDWRVARGQSLPVPEAAPVAWLRRAHILPQRTLPVLCILERR